MFSSSLFHGRRWREDLYWVGGGRERRDRKFCTVRDENIHIRFAPRALVMSYVYDSYYLCS